MSRQKIEDREIRKLIKLGGTSIATTIPIEIIRALGWRVHQKIVIRKKGDQIIIEDWKPSKKKKSLAKKK